MIANLRNGERRAYTVGQQMGAPAVESFEVFEADIAALLQMPDDRLRQYLQVLVMRFPPEGAQAQEVPDASL